MPRERVFLSSICVAVLLSVSVLFPTSTAEGIFDADYTEYFWMVETEMTPYASDVLKQVEAQLVAEYGSWALVKSSNEDAGDRMEQYGLLSTVLKGLDEIHVPFGVIETGSLPSLGPPPSELGPSESGYFLVQFVGPVKQEWINKLSERTTIERRLRNNSVLARAPPDSVEGIAALPFVKWVGRYAPYMKLDKSLIGNGLIESSLAIDLVVHLFDSASFEEPLDEVLSLGGNVLQSSEETGTLRLVLTGKLIWKLASMESVRMVQPLTFSQPRNSKATQIVQIGGLAGRPIFGEGVRGQDQIVTLSDSGLDTDHNAFSETNKVLEHYPVGIGELDKGQEHGTHTACTALGDRSPYDQHNGFDGHAISSQLIFQDGCNSETTCNFGSDFYNDLFKRSYDSDSRIHGIQVGLEGGYDYRARQIDQFLWDHREYLIVVESGFGHLDTIATSKNAISLGAGLNGLDKEKVWGWSPRGPFNNRLKPELIAPGVDIESADAETSDGKNAASGTSSASAATTGAAALVRDYLAGRDKDSPLYSANPSGALIKAMLINSGHEMSDATWSHGNHYEPPEGNPDWYYPNNDQGWGRILLEDVLYFDGDKNKLKFWDYTSGLTQGNHKWFDFYVYDVSQHVEITLVWNDPDDGSLQNDLNLLVMDPPAKEVKGNVFASYDASRPYGRSLPDDPGTSYSHDQTNNVEGVIIRKEIDNEIFPQVGQYWAEVTAELIVSGGSQPFALVVTGGLDIKPPDIFWTFPSDGVWRNDNTPTFMWQATDHGEAGLNGCYNLQISEDDAFSPPLFYDGQHCNLEKVDFATSELESPKTLLEDNYWWRVRAMDKADHFGDWSDGSEIKVDTNPPNSVTLECSDPGYPCDSGDPLNPWVANNRPLFSWSDPGDPGPNPSGVNYYWGCLDMGTCTIGGPGSRPIGNTNKYQETLTDGHHTFKVISVDTAENPATDWSNTIDIYVDVLPPTVNSFVIDDDAQYTVDSDVDLTMSIDDETGATEFMLANSLPGWVNVPTVRESMHYPYRNNVDETFLFSSPGSLKMRVYFSKIETEPWNSPKPDGGSDWVCRLSPLFCGDWVHVWGKTGFWNGWHYNRGPFLNQWVEVLGDEVFIRFRTDSYGNFYYGYRIESYGHYEDPWVGPFDYDSNEDPNYFCDIVGGSNPPGCWPLQPGPPGTRDVYLKVWDALGHVAEDQDSVFYDPIGPVVELWSPGDNHAQNTDSVFLKWKAEDQGSGISGNWIIWIDEDPAFPAPDVIPHWDNTPGPEGEYERQVNKPQGIYYWKVKGEDTAENWGDFSEHWKFTVETDLPGQPGKPQGVTDVSDPTISWTWTAPSPLPLSGIDAYYICVDDTTPVLEPNADCEWTDSNTYEYVGLEAHTYYAIVKARSRALNVGSWSQESDGITVIATPPPQVDIPTVSEVLNGPPIGQDDGDARYYVYWPRPTPPPGQTIDHYEVEEMDLAEGIWHAIEPVVFTEYVYLQEKAKGIQVTYEYRVRVVNQVGLKGPWSDPSNSVVVLADTTPPVLDIFLVEGDLIRTRERHVTLFPIAASDDGSPSSGILIRFRNSREPWSTWEPFVPVKSWTLSAGQGSKTVCAQVMDNAGNINNDIGLGILCDSIFYFPPHHKKPLSGISTPVETQVLVVLSGTEGADVVVDILGFDPTANKLLLEDSADLELLLGGGGLGGGESGDGGSTSLGGDGPPDGNESDEDAPVSIGGDPTLGGEGGESLSETNTTMAFQWNLTMNGCSSTVEGGYFVSLTYENHAVAAMNSVDIYVLNGYPVNAAHVEFDTFTGGSLQRIYVNLNSHLQNQSVGLYNESRFQLEIGVGEEVFVSPGDLAGDNVTNNWTSFHWDFGDGRNSTAMNVSLSYNSSGTYIVALTVAYEWYNTETIYLAVRVSQG